MYNYTHSFDSIPSEDYWGLLIALLLPLLFIATDLATIKVNLGAWAWYGIVYALLTYGVYKLLALRIGNH